jgi:hypothetical protein
MPVDRNACAQSDLLGPQGKTVGACRGAGLNVDVAVVPKVNEMFTFGGSEWISLWRRGLSRGHALGLYLADAEATQANQKGSAFLFERIHDNPLVGYGSSPVRIRKMPEWR